MIDRSGVVIPNNNLKSNIMKSSYLLSLGLISATLSVLAALPVPQASAQCVMNDTNIQLSMNGSGKKADQSNEVTQASSGGCVGNTVNSTNVQTQTGGTERATQRRQSHQQLNGSNDSPTGINMDPVKVKTNVQVNVDNPADRLRR
jgi:protein-disulfide isomerase